MEEGTIPKLSLHGNLPGVDKAVLKSYLCFSYRKWVQTSQKFSLLKFLDVLFHSMIHHKVFFNCTTFP